MKTKFPTQRKVTLDISSFEKGISLKFDKNLTNLDYARVLENFSFETGALTDGIGFDDLFIHIAKESDAKTLSSDIQSIGDIEKIIYFYKFNSQTQTREDKLIFISAEFEIYFVGLFDQTKQLSKLRNISFKSSPVALRYRLNGEDIIIFSSESNNMVVWDGTNSPYEVLNSPNISSMAVHFERLFATVDGEKNSIWFSDELDPTEWSISLDEAGFIEMVDERGALQKVISFNDYVYIFREFGITRLSAFGDQTQFSCSNLYVSSGKIYPNSVCVCGDKIIFLSSDGLYKFDGIDTVKILENIDQGFREIDNINAISCFSGSSYFLACNFTEKNGNYLNTILEIDTESYRLKNIFKGYDIKFITCINSSVINGVVAIIKEKSKKAFSVAYMAKNGIVFGKNTKKVWKSQTSMIGEPYAQKILRSIKIQSSTPLKFKVKADGETHEFDFYDSSNLSRKNCLIYANEFEFEIECNSNNTNIKNIELEFLKSRRKP